MVGAVRRIDGTALLLASLAAPGSSFLMWAAWSVVTGEPAAASFPEQLLGGVLMLLLITAWGAPLAAAFGTPVLWLVLRLRPDPPLWIQELAGVAAAALYAACFSGLALAGQEWIFLAAPWATGFLNPEHGRLHPEAPIITAIILSGGVGAAVYRRVSLRRVRPA